ncbi:MAG: pro-sigmaK processing inhibitor BofA family protein [Oscillospiraceae bacterium]|nr:pro-sigmaK processing inhibitor BofA family protein [Oscillospiraceae bacterium]
MSIVEILTLGLVLLFLTVALFRLFKTPLKLALRTIGNTALGFGALWMVNLTSAATGLSLGLNFFNALIIAVLGLPGLGLLLLVKWVLGST